MADLPETIDNETAEILLAILQEINNPTPDPDRKVIYCNCGCGAWHYPGDRVF
jgi:hypothetical protein